MKEFKKILVLAYSNIDHEFKPVPVKSWQDIMDALKQWYYYRMPIVIAYKAHFILEVPSDDQGVPCS